MTAHKSQEHNAQCKAPALYRTEHALPCGERERATIERVIKQSNTPFADIGPERRQPRYIRDSLLLLRALSHYWPSEHLTVDPPTLHDYGRGVTATASEM
jgi:hypothetical protein